MDPGITDTIAGYAADNLDHIYEIRMKDCDVIKSKELISPWAPDLLWRDMVAKPPVYKNGVFQRVSPFSGEEYYTFPDPIGSQPCYHHAHEEVVTMPRFLKDLRYVEFKMCGPDMPFAKAIYDYGIAGDKPIDVKGVKVVPLDVFLALTPRTPSMEEVEKKVNEGILIDEMACLLLDIKGEKNGEIVDSTFYTMLSLNDANRKMPGTTATSYYVGIGAEVFTELLVEGSIRSRGAIPPEALTSNERTAVIRRLAAKGITIDQISRKHIS
jgi:saccharopine dehydrogenase-like NADP-dependent oxidoreductase